MQLKWTMPSGVLANRGCHYCLVNENFCSLRTSWYGPTYGRSKDPPVSSVTDKPAFLVTLCYVTLAIEQKFSVLQEKSWRTRTFAHLPSKAYGEKSLLSRWSRAQVQLWPELGLKRDHQEDTQDRKIARSSSNTYACPARPLPKKRGAVVW